jgi:hypothetical protein
MTIEEMEAIAGARSKGRWLFIKNLHGYTTHGLYDNEIKGTWTSWDTKDSDDADARFSAMAASKMDALLQLAACAKGIVEVYKHFPNTLCYDIAMQSLSANLDEVEK